VNLNRPPRVQIGVDTRATVPWLPWRDKCVVNNAVVVGRGVGCHANRAVPTIDIVRSDQHVHVIGWIHRQPTISVLEHVVRVQKVLGALVVIKGLIVRLWPRLHVCR
jgi:hypothetical protein